MHDRDVHNEICTDFEITIQRCNPYDYRRCWILGVECYRKREARKVFYRRPPARQLKCATKIVKMSLCRRNFGNRRCGDFGVDVRTKQRIVNNSFTDRDRATPTGQIWLVANLLADHRYLTNEGATSTCVDAEHSCGSTTHPQTLPHFGPDRVTKRAERNPAMSPRCEPWRTRTPDDGRFI